MNCLKIRVWMGMRIQLVFKALSKGPKDRSVNCTQAVLYQMEALLRPTSNGLITDNEQRTLKNNLI